MKFKLVSKNKPAGDQPQAIKEINNNLNKKQKYQVLLGVTGSGKTFTMANIIAKQNRPTLILSHNKTLASQLYSEMKSLFPENRVEYFVSYFDYYRPEAYLPAKDVYIEKSSQNNKDLEAMRMGALNALSMRRDSIVIASVAAIYSEGNPNEYRINFLNIEIGMKIKPSSFFTKLVKRHYSRNNIGFESGNFSVKGDIVEIFPSWTNEFLIQVGFFGDEIESIAQIHPITKNIIKKLHSYVIFPASTYTIRQSIIDSAVEQIKIELVERLKYFKEQKKELEYQRLKERINNDIDSMEEFGFCSGMENYSRHIDGRKEGEKPYTLLDFMPNDALLIIDESHMMIPQLNAMYNGDRSRKQNLVDYGFRLPSALDNRPLKFEEFEKYNFDTIYVSATPAEFELDKTHGVVVSQINRPTGLLDPIIEIIPAKNQIENIYDQIKNQIDKKERTLILTTTKKTAEEFSKFFQSKGIKIAYIHSDHKIFERNEILRKLRKGIYDVVIGINLLREGIDLPEVSLIMVLDADKESFFRSKTSLIQIVGRAARNISGKVIFYADTISKSMQAAIDDNREKRKIQIAYNKKHNIIPKSVIKEIADPIQGGDLKDSINHVLAQKKRNSKSTVKEIEKIIDSLRKEMRNAAEQLDFERAATIRDLILELESDL